MFNKRAFLVFFLIFITIMLVYAQKVLDPRETVSLSHTVIPEISEVHGIVETQNLASEFIMNISVVDNNKIYTFIAKEASDTFFSNFPMYIFNINWENFEYQIIRSEKYMNLATNRVIGLSDNADFKKIIYTTSTNTNIILVKELYKDQNSKNPQFTFNANDIILYKDNYIVNQWTIKDNTKQMEYKFSLNIEKIVF